MNAASRSPQRAARYTIGQVQQKLGAEFPELTPSKVRFLEDEGLITPARTSSGYRKFTQGDIDRIRVILTLQRDRYLRLRVIRELLEAVDTGADPEIPGSAGQRFSSMLQPRKVLTRQELLRATGASEQLLRAAISADLVAAGEVFAADTVPQLEALVKLAERGLTPRHLRTVSLAAQKQVDLIQETVFSRTGKVHTPENYEEQLALAELLQVVQATVVRARLRRS